MICFNRCDSNGVFCGNDEVEFFPNNQLVMLLVYWYKVFIDTKIYSVLLFPEKKKISINMASDQWLILVVNGSAINRARDTSHTNWNIAAEIYK